MGEEERWKTGQGQDVLALNESPGFDRTTAPWSVHEPGSIVGLVATPIAEFWVPSCETE